MPHRPLLALLLCTALSCGLQAADANREIVETMDAQRMVSVLNELGFVNHSVTDDGDMIVSIAGHQHMLLIGSHKGVALRFRMWLSGAGATMEKANDWNINYLFSRSYIDSDGDINLESDLDLDQGVTLGRVGNFVQTYAQLVTRFVEHVEGP